MSVEQFRAEFPNGVPIKNKSKRTPIKNLQPSVGNDEQEDKKAPKYGNEKTQVMGIVFDSKKEADRYLELRGMEQKKLISNLRIQVEFVLLGEVYFELENKKKRPLKYVADFCYYCHVRNKEIIEDVKSEKTAQLPLYRAKKHMMKYLLGLEISEV